MSFRSILAVLDGPAPERADVLQRAVALAEGDRARLTLTAVSHPGRTLSWLSPLALPAQAPTQEELDQEACHRLALAAEHVPGGVPLTTFVVREPVRRAVHRLAASGTYDLLVVGAHLAGREAATARCLRGLGLSVLVVTGEEANVVAAADVLQAG